MLQFLLLVVIALVIAALVFGVAALVTGDDPGLTPVEPDGVSRGLPGSRPLVEQDLADARFDVAFRGYRMSQVDAAVARAAYDVGFKQEMIDALRAEVAALWEGRTEDAAKIRRAREAASGVRQDPGEPDRHGVPAPPSGDDSGQDGPVPDDSVPDDSVPDDSVPVAGEQADAGPAERAQ